MLSYQQAIEIKESIVSYLKATFTFREKEVAKAFDDFIYHPDLGIFKGPYISLKLRFEKASEEAYRKIPLEIKPSWAPYDHQVRAWHQLSTVEKEPQPTIVTTGTGSGKTEAFLYPILDYCYRQKHRSGIKVIIMYPMNALATDQAKRLAEIINEDERLKGKVTAGLFIGEGEGAKGSYPRTMGAENIVEDRNSIVDSPPDILLTNFKMLDYALMKHQYHNLWVHNLNDPSLFRFLVLDELHTYDGAQGTDVANLIRRLKLKLGMEPGQLCPVGTSATIGSGKDAPVLLSDYASKVFGEAISPDAIITENRVLSESFFGPDEDLRKYVPTVAALQELVYHEREGLDSYIQSHIDAWGLSGEVLAEGLLQLKILKDLLNIFQKRRSILTPKELVRELSICNEEFRQIPNWDEANDYSPQEQLLESIFTLIAQAKDVENPRLPFIYLQVQLWIRELSGVQYTIEKPAKFSFRDHVDSVKELAALPPWYCRECNASGWLGHKKENEAAFSKDINTVYSKFFERDKNVYFILAKDTLNEDELRVTGYKPDDFLNETIDPLTLKFLDKDEEGFEIQALRKLNDNNRAEEICPCCNTNNTIAIVGTKIPTFSSIAVSQSLSTDLDAATEKDRKVLAFTNSVQDAAHQAGFIESRNYRFTLRTSIQKMINQQTEPIRLTDLANEFQNYWKTHSDQTETDSLSAYLYRFYPKDHIGKSSPENFKTGLTYQSDFLKEFDNRIVWEVCSEFSFNSKIGRTLEKTGASSVHFDRDALRKSWVLMRKWIEQNDVSRQINEGDFLKLSNVILHRMRNRGAVDNLFLKKYREGELRLWDLNWSRDKRHYLNPKFGTRSRLPKLISKENSKKGLLDATSTKLNNWYHAYFKKTFPLAAVTNEFLNEFYSEWIDAMVAVGIMNSANAGENENYAINPEMIWVEKEVKVYNCNLCEDTLYTDDEPEMIEGALCMRFRCQGSYKQDEKITKNYYKAVYNRSRSPRVYSQEHTGLLLREPREKLERDFKRRERFNSVNALVATSTLEMGIDIGDLNTAYNNSTPPLPSNFLQRVGRAGRSSGSALIVNFVKNQNHDLYYYTDPLEMMDGEINTPGCFLEAKDILKRHFTAFCIDSWTSENPKENIIPNFVRDLKLGEAKLTEDIFFVNRLNNFIDNNNDELLRNFFSQYPIEVKKKLEDLVWEDLQTGSFYTRLLDVFQNIQSELRNIDQQRASINDEIKTLGLKKGDPLLEEYQREIRSTVALKKAINDRLILEHLTNRGILPNYAFPETGVKLNGQVLGVNLEEGANPALDKNYELVRPASQAIKELAPENFFYTQGYRFEISGLNTFDWSEHLNYHTKRFCSKCDHLDVEDGLTSPYKTCPKCGDLSWGSSSNVHPYVKMTNVKSYNSSVKATLTDSSDDRDRQNYKLMHHLYFEPNTSQGAWVLKDVPFGIEFLRNVKIVTANYGRQDTNDARKIKINNEEVPTKGFVTCRHCGKSASATHLLNEAKDFHYGYCKHKDVKYSPDRDDVFEEVYLFREIRTEILKIVLPVQELNTEEDIRMFLAGLNLGLRKYFKGNISHLSFLSYREYNQNTHKFDRFLVLYDTIPGGTGYLEDLFDADNFTALIKASYDTIKDCSCQHHNHDGCYKCIYSYGNQYHREGLSRAKAESWFKRIYESCESWEQDLKGLTAVTQTGRIEESELEERFVSILKRGAEQEKGFAFEEVMDSGRIYYKISIDEGDIEAKYSVIPQVLLGPKDGIEFNTRTDFLIKCSKYIAKGNDYTDKVPKIAVYLDGYQYHASEDHNVLGHDIELRKAIIKHSHYKTWTLTWHDLDLYEQQMEERRMVPDGLAENYKLNFQRSFNEKLFPMLIKPDEKNWKVSYATALNNMERLRLQLLWPEIDLYAISWFTYLISWTKELLKPSFNPNDLKQVIAGTLSSANYIQMHRITDMDALIPVEAQNNFKFADWKIWVNRKERAIFNKLELKELRNIDKEEWQYFWTLFNIFQSDFFVSENDTIDADEQVKEIDLLQQICELYDEEYYDLLKVAVERGYINEKNIDSIDSLLDEYGNILADAELVLVDAKVAIEPFSDESRSIFIENGFTIYELSKIKTIDL